jgi:hypothetical protein
VSRTRDDERPDPDPDASSSKNIDHRNANDDNRDQRKSPDGTITVVLTVITPLLGALIYILLRGSYVRIYSRFGVKPEDAGMEYFAVLTSAARLLRAGDFRIYSGLVTTLFEITVIVALGWVLWRRARKSLSPVQYLLAYSSLLLGVGFLVLSWQVSNDIKEAYQATVAGERIRPGDLHFLSFQAYKSEVTWVSEKPEPQPLKSSKAFMYLGSAGGKAILVDFEKKPHKTLRLDEQSALIVLDPCYENKESKENCDL